MPKCIIESTTRVTARLRNCGYRSRGVVHETLKDISKLISFIYKIISIIYWYIRALRPLAPDKVDHLIIVHHVNGTARGNFVKIPIALSRPYLSDESKNEDRLMDSHWKVQIDSTIISPDPATCSITPSPAGTRPANPSLLCLFCFH
jgi:hypothetical protein